MQAVFAKVAADLTHWSSLTGQGHAVQAPAQQTASRRLLSLQEAASRLAVAAA